jgi:hypothetical protein
MLTLVPTNYLSTVWEQAEPMIARYLANPELYGSTDYIFSELSTGSKQLWVDLEGEDVKFAIITRIEITTAGLKILHIINSGSKEGSKLQEINFQAYREFLEDTAKTLGFSGVAAMTRAGLAKEYVGYKEIGRVLLKRF